ncbi:hypothetical protein RJ639_015440 [Escallonia herrerae]|uniref:Uncharacterized protein n=1 Tax=Escallonia herrerae TaxID=1293975 RepID=A0AA89AMB5_9ASTE|nr:hypothetical protein RJ639_015440 [Escallonia herrerae]
MISVGAKLARAARRICPPIFSLHRPPSSFLCHNPPLLPPVPTRFLSTIERFRPNPVTTQMVDYALSLARSHKSGSGMNHTSKGYWFWNSVNPRSEMIIHSKGVVLLAAFTILYERENFDGAIDKLQRIKDLSISSVAVKVAAAEALAGLHLELCQDDAASVHADLCLQLLDIIKLEIDSPHDIGVLDARIKAIRELVELVLGDPESCMAKSCSAIIFCNSSCGNVALSHGQFLHAIRKLSMAKEYYRKAIQGISENNDFSDPYNLAACNMTTKEVLLAATCGLGQLEAHLGNFADAEEILTQALTRAEEHFGSRHPKVGVVLTCIALMFRHKATVECSSSLLVQEKSNRATQSSSTGEQRYTEYSISYSAPLGKQILDLVSPFDSTGIEEKAYRRDIVALARGMILIQMPIVMLNLIPALIFGRPFPLCDYQKLCLQQNRKAEGERMKSWAETAWGNHRLSLAEALEVSENSSVVPVIDARISRVV